MDSLSTLQMAQQSEVALSGHMSLTSLLLDTFPMVLQTDLALKGLIVVSSESPTEICTIALETEQQTLINQPPSKTPLHVLLSEEDLQELFSAIIADVISSTRELKLRVHTSTHAFHIIGLAARIHFDLFIFFLNNIVFPTANMPAEERVTQALKFVTQLKTRYQKPISGLYGWPKEEAYGRRAKMAGADFVFIIPEKPLKLRAAVADCLEPILKSGVDTELLEAKEPKGETYGKPSSTE